MAKRFTDSEKWDKRWFRTLPTEIKLFWLYICDSCDQAGIWSEDLDLAQFKMGVSINTEDLATHLKGRIIRLDADKIFIPSFIQFQYGELSEDCKPHQKVIKILKQYRIDPKTLRVPEGCSESLKGYPKGIHTLEEEEEEEEENKEEDKVKEEEEEKKESTLSIEIDECCETYRETLRYYKQGRTLLDAEKFSIGRAIQTYGATAVKLALVGARYEPKSIKFNPADWVDLTRYLDPKNFKRMLGYGVKRAQDQQEASS